MRKETVSKKTRFFYKVDSLPSLIHLIFKEYKTGDYL